MQANKGFTLLELMVVIAIMGVALAIGIPSMQDAMRDSIVKEQILRISKDVIATRNHAINYETTASICPLAARNDSSECGNDWNEGYMVFLDGNADGAFTQDNDKLLFVRNELVEFGNLFFPATSFSYTMDGTYSNQELNGLPYRFEFCPHSTNANNVANHSRAVIINLGGRPRSSADINDDGKHEFWSNGMTAQAQDIDCV
ncbi:prepilin-type N-terminal cleavage/methylation domain-containing protein [Catenovulum sp. SM1970]|uniref:GspH/FimT family pseudopilin n=1 Tax=Marinifaba aquimaris TaxID=2741323 RepID=UPI001573CCAC|nr:GspH/FimT family pseudopilin [Marinifaba aquimaris]NTS77161.1 prepilin-type N-terminal cleavage/methylation domain-containing protein [Marinifaba aquimaris]